MPRDIIVQFQVRSRRTQRQINMANIEDLIAPIADIGKNTGIKGNDPKAKGTADGPSRSQNQEEIPVTLDDCDAEQKATLVDAMKQFQDKLVSAFTKNRSGKPYLRGTLLKGLLSDVDLSTPLEQRMAALQEVVNEMDGGTSMQLKNKTDIAFLDPVIVNENICKCINSNPHDTVENLTQVFLKCEDKESILLASKFTIMSS
ncbi:hypothetical protein BAE44_0010352 [Dichanthelium oligosanthes]|uniref:Uncharacterized protein n=1 Tax=Dichanthelium oligosanthes TaxID=888268 RepID=A0A1E5VU30_9POAL|nr:hypothetical protein BAE44_0010352 [Dichanthelium oligosanthes]